MKYLGRKTIVYLEISQKLNGTPDAITNNYSYYSYVYIVISRSLFLKLNEYLYINISILYDRLFYTNRKITPLSVTI